MNLFFVIIPNLTANVSLNGQVQNGVATLHVLLLFDFPIDYWMEHWWEMGYILESYGRYRTELGRYLIQHINPAKESRQRIIYKSYGVRMVLEGNGSCKTHPGFFTEKKYCLDQTISSLE